MSRWERAVKRVLQTEHWPKANGTKTMKRSLIFLLVTAALTALAQVTPSWWSGRGALTPGVSADDFAAINQGQLKNLARVAVLEFEEKLPGGAGQDLLDLIDSWNVVGEETDDYAVVTHGQLKAMADLFYARLEAVRSQVAPNWSQVTTPWASPVGASGVPEHTAVANIGQVKHLFAGLEGDRGMHAFNGMSGSPESFRFGLAWLKDTDGDGVSDVQEVLVGSNPADGTSQPAEAVSESFVVFTILRH
jgi:hypothetical protein